MGNQLTFRGQSDDAVEINLKRLVSDERRLSVEILRHLREVERRKLFLKRGFPSLFQYVRAELKYSEDQAQRRIAAMREMVESPEIEEKLADGALTLTQVAMVRSVLNEGKKNGVPISSATRAEVFSAVEGKSTRETEFALRAIVPEMPRSEIVRPVNADTVELRLNIPREVYDQLREIQDLAGHALDGERSMEKLLTYLASRALKDLRKEKLGEGVRPYRRREKPAEKDSAMEPENVAPSPAAPKVHFAPTIRPHIPLFTRRLIFNRDKGQCQYRDPQTGRICGSTHLAEIDHIRPLSRGGAPLDPENLRVLCDQHNRGRNPRGSASRRRN